MRWISVDEPLPPFRERVLVVEERKGVSPLCLYPEGFQGEARFGVGREFPKTRI